MLFLWKLFYFSTKWFKCESGGMVTMSLKGVWRREGRKNSSHAGHSGDKPVSARALMVSHSGQSQKKEKEGIVG